MNPNQWTRLYLTSLLWGSSFMFFDIGLSGFGPVTLVFVRVFFGAAFLFILFGGRLERLRAMARHWKVLVPLGAAACTLPFTFYAYGLQHVNTSTAGVINAMMPAFTFLVAVAVGQERFGAGRLAGTLVGIAGVGILLGPDGIGDDSKVLGALYCLLATVCYGFYAVGVKRLARDIPPEQLTTGMIAWSAATMLPVALALEGLPEWPVSMAALGASMAVGLLGTCLAYMVFIRLIGEVGATNASVTTLLIPINAVLLGVALLGERLDGWFFLGSAVIILSIFLIDSGTRGLLLRLVPGAGKA